MNYYQDMVNLTNSIHDHMEKEFRDSIDKEEVHKKMLEFNDLRMNMLKFLKHNHFPTSQHI